MKFFRQEDKVFIGLQISPMADMIFQLLIFFMLITVLKNVHNIVDDLPRATQGKELLGESREVVININEQGTIFIGPIVYDLSTLKTYLTTQEKTPKTKIYIRGDKEVDWEKVRELIKICAEIGFQNISFGVYEREASQ